MKYLNLELPRLKTVWSLRIEAYQERDKDG
jgi:hypothetical protein